MPIICENFGESTEKNPLKTMNRFVLAHSEPIPLTSLGPNWHFDPCFLPKKYKDYAEQIENLDIFPDDVLSVTYPKCGSTWSQEMIWLLCNNLNYEKALETDIFLRFPIIEGDLFMPNEQISILEMIKGMPSPRMLKSHLPVGLIPKQVWSVKPKIIYTARSIKDEAISFYHHYVNLHHYKGTKEDFLNAHLNKQLPYSPIHSHIRDYWFMREEENILFITYEEMKDDLCSVLKKTCTFLNKSYSDEQLLTLEKHLSFDSMKNNPSVNYENISSYLRGEVEQNLPNGAESSGIRFMRKGKVGSHKEEMTPEFIQRFDELTERFNQTYGTSITP